MVAAASRRTQPPRRRSSRSPAYAERAPAAAAEAPALDDLLAEAMHRCLARKESEAKRLAEPPPLPPPPMERARTTTLRVRALPAPGRVRDRRRLRSLLLLGSMLAGAGLAYLLISLYGLL